MQNNTNKTIWRRVGIIVVLLPFCFFFPFILLIVGWLIWTIFQDVMTPSITPVPPPTTWRDVNAEDSDWLNQFCSGCESPAEEAFVLAMVEAFNLKPDNGKLACPDLTLEMQVSVGHYRFDFLANGRQVIEIDGAAWHSSPEQKERDRIRDEYSVERGYRVVRIAAETVFNAPDKAIEQVKTALKETPVFTKPFKQKPAAPMKRVSFIEVLEDINRHVEITSIKQTTLASFKSAISTEQILLEALVSEVDFEIKSEIHLKTMPSSAKELYESSRARIKVLLEDCDTQKSSLAEIYCWKEINKPSEVNDRETQEQIERECQTTLVQRNLRLEQLSQRCIVEPEFGHLFRRKLEKFIIRQLS